MAVSPSLECEAYVTIVKDEYNVRFFGSNHLFDTVLREHHRFVTLTTDPETKCRFNEKIFGVGLIKTGTISLAHAMYILGYKSYHEPYYIDRIWEHDFYNDIIIASRYKFLDHVFPNAKFILTIRDNDSWIQAVERWWMNLEMGDKKNNGERRKGNTIFDPLSSAENRFNIFGSIYYDEDNYRKSHLKHIREVKNYFKGRKNKLLVLDICGGEGWKKLCKFLDKDIPDDSFPHDNKGF